MLIGYHMGYVAEWVGRTPYGPLYAIRIGPDTFYRGSLSYVALQWRNITGQTLTI